MSSLHQAEMFAKKKKKKKKIAVKCSHHLNHTNVAKYE